jgi:hypothetical protein
VAGRAVATLPATPIIFIGQNLSLAYFPAN